MRSMHLSFAALCLASLGALSCSGGQTSAADASARGLCPGAKQQSEPLIVEWSSSARGQLEALRGKHVVAVRYTGCELEVLAQCNVPARYNYAPITPKHERIAVHDESELFANIPLHAAALSGKLKSAGELNVDMTVVGRFEAEHAEVRPEELSGDCAGATHVIAGLSAGAFSFFSGSDKSAGAGVDVGGLGGNAKTSAKREVLNEDGDRAACSTAAPGDKAPPFKCGALVRIELVPLGAPKQAAPSCSPATHWDGTQCVRSEGGGGCPAGTLVAGGNCVPEDGKTCPAGWRIEDGPRCARDVGPAAPGACPAETHREGGGCVANAAGPGPMVRILGNTFVMGTHCPNGDCAPSHRVTVPTFDIDLLEVSVAQYKACVDARRCVIPMADGQCNWGKDGRQHHPINCVDWAQSKTYCEWAGRRLPTEAEWEFAAVGQTGWEYPWGNEHPDKKHHCSRTQYPAQTCPGGTAMDGRSRFGVLDMFGNVAEWTADAWCEYPHGDNPPRCEPNNRVTRNGPRAAERSRSQATHWDDGKGFRCAKTP